MLRAASSGRTPRVARGGCRHGRVAAVELAGESERQGRPRGPRDEVVALEPPVRRRGGADRTCSSTSPRCVGTARRTAGTRCRPATQRWPASTQTWRREAEAAQTTSGSSALATTRSTSAIAARQVAATRPTSWWRCSWSRVRLRSTTTPGRVCSTAQGNHPRRSRARRWGPSPSRACARPGGGVGPVGVGVGRTGTPQRRREQGRGGRLAVGGAHQEHVAARRQGRDGLGAILRSARPPMTPPCSQGRGAATGTEAARSGAAREA